MLVHNEITYVFVVLLIHYEMLIHNGILSILYNFVVVEDDVLNSQYNLGWP